jgi:hypothetical protein
MLTTYAQIRAVGNLPDSVDEKVLRPHAFMAENEIRKILSDEVYDALPDLDDDNRKKIACDLAEANLAFSYALPSLNIETQGTGIVRTKGWDQSRSDMLSQSEIESLQEKYKTVAMDLLQPYIPQPEPVDDETPVDEVIGGNYSLSAL